MSTSGQVVEVDVGGAADGPVIVVTNAPNVRLESRVAVALVGAVVGDVTVTKSKVGGRTSEGMLCDSTMLGWSGGASGVGKALVCGACVHAMQCIRL